MTPYESDEQSQPYDNHSGSRLLLLVLLVPLAIVAGLAGWKVTRELTVDLLGYVSAQRAAYVAGALAAGATILALLRFQWALSPQAQSTASEEIDEMEEDDGA
jgi:hypothetical protein